MKSEGFWLHAKRSSWMLIDDHARAVQTEPRTFGVPVRAAAQLIRGLTSDYNALRMLAIQRSWIRVRSWRTGEVSAELWFSPVDRAISKLATFLKKQGFGLLTRVTVNDLRKRKSHSGKLKDFLDLKRSLAVVDFDAATNRKMDALCERMRRLRDGS